MQVFTTLNAIAAPLPLANIDTDKILAAEYLKTITRKGLGTKLFAAMRYDSNGKAKDNFILNQNPWNKAGILIAYENFGCGSSREHAPWALADFGIRCIIAPSFADIFYNNCFKNSILPIQLDRATVDILMANAMNPTTCTYTIDLPTQTIQQSNGNIIRFDIEKNRKEALLFGLDEIDASLHLSAKITKWETTNQVIAPPISKSLKFST